MMKETAQNATMRSRWRSRAETRRIVSLAFVGMMALATASHAEAQGRGRSDQARGKNSQGIPPGHLPPAGSCRVWYDSRPPGQQPAPTSCTNARVTAAQTGGRVIYGDDRARNDRRYDDRDCSNKDRKKGDCVADRDRDRDRNRDDTRYPDRTYPTTLPEMIWGLGGGQNEYRNQVIPWVGTDPVRVHFTDADRNGTPEVVTWTDNAGRLLQRWFDDNRDGRADRVALYQNNRITRIIR